MATEKIHGLAREFAFQLLLVRAERICRVIAEHIAAHHQHVVLHWESAWGAIATVCVDLQRWIDENRSQASINIEGRLYRVEQITQSVKDLRESVAAGTLSEVEHDFVTQLHDLGLCLRKFRDSVQSTAEVLSSSEEAASASAWSHTLQRCLWVEMPGLPKTIHRLMG